MCSKCVVDYIPAISNFVKWLKPGLSLTFLSLSQHWHYISQDSLEQNGFRGESGGGGGVVCMVSNSGRYVYMPLHKVPDTPLHLQGDDISNDLQHV